LPDIERIYTIPLKMSKNVPRTKRAQHALGLIRSFVISHMNAEKKNIWIDPKLSEAIWARGMEHPPKSVRVRVIKFEDDVVEVSLPEE